MSKVNCFIDANDSLDVELNEECRHKWKSDQYFTAQTFTTCTECGMTWEDFIDTCRRTNHDREWRRVYLT